MKDRKGNNILMMAIQFGEVEMVELMLSSKTVPINDQNVKGQSALHIAI
jgi:ankyrin repeat protein